MEVIKYFTGYGKPLEGRLLIFDGEAATFREFELRRDPDCPDCGSPHAQERP
jgi:adenylyltransferase/sulfurtransferase